MADRYRRPAPAASADAAGGARLAAIVLNYRTPERSARAVDSLQRSSRTPDQIIVVDNGTADGGAAKLLSLLPGAVTYLPTRTNLGFSGGMNAGIARALADGAALVLMVNSDAVLAPDCLAALEAAVAGPDVGIAAPILRAPGNRNRVMSCGLRYSRRFARMRERREEVQMRSDAGVLRVDAVSGCVMLVRTAVFEAVGLFDEAYFYSFEDLDFCLSAGGAGFASVVASRATAWHDGSGSIGRDSSRRLYFAARNHQRLAARLAPSRGRVLAAAQFTSILALNAAHALTAPGGTVRQRLDAVWAGTRDYLAGRFGVGAAPGDYAGG